MDTREHTMGTLFEQLGLPHSEGDIQRFLATHHIDAAISLPEAPFWSEAQACFLREAWEADDDWIMVIDELNTALRKTPPVKGKPDYDISRPSH